MRRRRGIDEPDIPPQINIVPMIDVVFAILTFFIMSSLYLTRSEGIPVNLPSATTAKLQQSAPVTITIDQNGQIALNRQAIDLDQVEAQVTAQLANAENKLVIINADERVSHGQVVAVMDRVRQINGARLAIQTQRSR